jgi:hypothetical protein
VSATDLLLPARTLDQLLPTGVAYAPRTTLEHVGWVLSEAYRLDTLTGLTLLVTGSVPLACHQNTVTPAIVAFFEKCGATPSPHRAPYERAEQAFDQTRRWAEQGRRIVSPYPLPADVCEPQSLLVPDALYRWLNDKSNLDALVDADWLPPSVMLRPDAARDLLTAFAGKPVYVKACVAGASGAGIDVRYTPDAQARHQALDWLAGHAHGYSGVRVELALEIPICWCLNLAIQDDRVEYLGAAIQLFSSPGQQSGSLIDPRQAPPAMAVEAVMRIARKAQQMGYRGLAGFDLGLTEDARPFIFDLNFRMVSSTVQLLLHQSAVERIGGCVTESWHQLTHGPLAPVLAAIEPLGRSGRFVPCRLWEANPESRGRSMITGFLVGESAEDLACTRRAMASALGPLVV